jgi:putative OPT family oligopeptide transporter
VTREAPFVPYVAAERRVAEFTLPAVLLGTLLSVAFGMVNAYLGLKIGLTVSASIPSAVLSMAILRGVLRRGTVLENNVAHTVASAGESLAAGVVFTVPALFFIGIDPGGFRIFLIAATAGLLGILAMIPLRHELTIAEHARLPFPEGTACAQVLIAGDRGRSEARPVFTGLAVGAAYQFAMRGLNLWRDTIFLTFPSLHKLSIGAELSPLFLGVGYLVGARIAAIMLSGGVIAWVFLIPLFDLLSGSAAGNLLGLSPHLAGADAFQIWSLHVRFVGAGAVACGGAVSIVRTVPLLLRSLRTAAPAGAALVPRRIRTELDLSNRVVFGGVAAVAGALWLIPTFQMGLAQTLLAVSFSVFFVVVSARIVGLVGTTSQPVSGMTITALLVSAFALHALGYRGSDGVAASLAVAVVVCVAVALSGDISQDLKCGALVGATPRALQIGEIIGVAAAALRAGWVLYLLHKAYTVGSAFLPAPQAKLMATLAQGVMQGELPWALLILGAGLAGVAELAGLASLPFAIGLYLPITTTASLIAGGLMASSLRRREDGAGTLLASGLIAGDALVGIAIAGLVVTGWDARLALRSPGNGGAEMLLTVLPFAGLAWLLARTERARGQTLNRAD